MNKKMKKQLGKIVVSLLLLILAFIVRGYNKYLGIVLFTLSYIIVGYEIIFKALRNIKRGKVFDENFLMTIATIGAFCVGELPEAVTVMLFYQIGEFFQNYAVDRSRKSIASLMDIRPDYACVMRDGKGVIVNPSEVKVDEIILIKPGEKIPLDGVVVSGNSIIDTVKLTGESIPRVIKVGDEVISGCINNQGVIQVRVTKEFGESTVSKILDLVENASSRKSNSENFITKFAKYYTPIVVIVALILAIFPPLIFNDSFKEWIYRALSFLVVSCPCALVVSIPLSFFGGIGAASRMGILIKGSNYLEALSNTSVVVCDKTGTLTEGVFKVQKIEPKDISREDLLEYAAMAESFSNHPISESLRLAYGKEIDNKRVTDVKETPGMGVIAKIDGKTLVIGNDKLLKREGIKFTKVSDKGTVIYVAIDNSYKGMIVIADKIKDGTHLAIRNLRGNGVKKVIMLTGDREDISREISKELELDEYYAELLPQDKVKIVSQLIENCDTSGGVLFVGDGINDAPVLALTNVGVAMGGLGSDAAIAAASVVIMSDEISKIVDAIKLSRKTMMIVRENINFTFFVKILVLVLSALGIATMWSAVFADVGVSILAILNALRLLSFGSKK